MQKSRAKRNSWRQCLSEGNHGSPRTDIIIGAGPTGPNAIYEQLARTGIRPMIIEVSELSGSIPATNTYKGNHIGGEISSRVKLSVVVTVFSETFSIRETVDILLSKDRGYIHEIILLVSPRASEEAMAICREQADRDPRVRIVIQEKNPGIGWAYREGMRAATGNYVALMAADLETEPAAVDRMVDKILETGCDGVIANRWLPGGGFTNYDPLKYVLNWIFQKMFGIAFWTKLGDLTFGFKILSKEIAETIPWEGTLHEICIETTVKPIQYGYRLEQVPSAWVGRKEGASVNTFFKNFRYVRMAFHTLFASRAQIKTQ